MVTTTFVVVLMLVTLKVLIRFSKAWCIKFLKNTPQTEILIAAVLNVMMMAILIVTQ